MIRPTRFQMTNRFQLLFVFERKKSSEFPGRLDIVRRLYQLFIHESIYYNKFETMKP